MKQNTLVVWKMFFPVPFKGHIVKLPVFLSVSVCIWKPLKNLQAATWFQVFPSGSGTKSGKSLERARGVFVVVDFCWRKGWMGYPKNPISQSKMATRTPAIQVNEHPKPWRVQPEILIYRVSSFQKTPRCSMGLLNNTYLECKRPRSWLEWRRLVFGWYFLSKNRGSVGDLGLDLRTQKPTQKCFGIITESVWVWAPGLSIVWFTAERVNSSLNGVDGKGISKYLKHSGFGIIHRIHVSWKQPNVGLDLLKVIFYFLTR